MPNKHDISKPEVALTMPSQAELPTEPAVPPADEPSPFDRALAEYHRRLRDDNWLRDAVCEGLSDEQFRDMVYFLLNCPCQGGVPEALRDYIWPHEIYERGRGD